MAEEAQVPEEGAPKKGGSPIVRGFIVILVVMIVEAVVVVTVMRGTSTSTGTSGTTATGAEDGDKGQNDLKAPSIEVKNVITSIRVDTAGNKLKNLVVSVSIKLGRDQDHPEAILDTETLESEYLPLVQNFIPEFKHILLSELSSRQYAELQDPDVRQRIIEKMIKTSNDRLKNKYKMDPRIADIYFLTFTFD